MCATPLEVLNELRLEAKLIDVVIRVDGFTFNAHRAVLCECSSYFRCILLRDPPNKRDYNIPGVSPHIMHLIIEYVYTHSVNVTEQNVKALLAAADQFNIMGVVGACCDFLEGQLCPENCIGTWKYMERYQCPDLRRKACQYILAHFEKLAYISKEFLELSPHDLADIIEKDELNAIETVVFEAVLRWINHKSKDRKGYIFLLLSKIRMAFLSDGYMQNVMEKVLAEDNSKCKPIIVSAIRSMRHFIASMATSSSGHNYHACPRLPHTILLAIGGLNEFRSTNAIEAYDIRADHWMNVTNDGRPQAGLGTVVLNHFIYCVGGCDGVNVYYSAFKFDLLKRTWHQVAAMNHRRCYASLVVLNDCFYVMGGHDEFEILNTVERYGPDVDRWSLVQPMHEQRSSASATTLHGKVYICGGFNGIESLMSAECYDPQTGQWSLISPMATRRSGLGVVTYRDNIYAVGGFDGVNSLCSLEAYSLDENTWRGVPPMNTPRRSFGLAVVEDALYVAGGFNGTASLSSVERYRESTNQWSQVHDMKFPRRGLSCCVAHGLPNVTEYTAPRD